MRVIWIEVKDRTGKQIDFFKENVYLSLLWIVSASFKFCLLHEISA